MPRQHQTQSRQKRQQSMNSQELSSDDIAEILRGLPGLEEQQAFLSPKNQGLMEKVGHGMDSSHIALEALKQAPHGVKVLSKMSLAGSLVAETVLLGNEIHEAHLKDPDHGDEFKKDVTVSTAGTIGSIGGSIGGAKLGALAGGALGLLIGGPIGLAIGAVLGGLIGAYVGSSAGKAALQAGVRKVIELMEKDDVDLDTSTLESILDDIEDLEEEDEIDISQDEIDAALATLND